MTQKQPTLFLITESEIGPLGCEELAVPDVAVAVLHNPHTDMVLLIRRSRGTDYVGWAFPGGKIERLNRSRASEDPVAAARRELKEETGLLIREAGKEIFCRKHPATGVLIRYIYFLCERLPPAASSLERDKADDCAWVQLSKVSKMFRGGLSEGIVRGINRELNSAGKGTRQASQTSLQFEHG